MQFVHSFLTEIRDCWLVQPHP